MIDVFHWIGVAAVATVAIAVVGAGLFWLYANFLHGRFSTILFRKGQRRLSIASWHQSRLLMRGGDSQPNEWQADDWPVNERPLYLSFRVGNRRLFILAGLLSNVRDSVIRGAHP